MDHSAGERMAKSAWGLFFVFVIILGIVTGCGEGMDQAAGDKGLSSGPAGINATFEKILKRSSSFASQVLRPTLEDGRLKTLELGAQDNPIDVKQAQALLLTHRDELGLTQDLIDSALKPIHAAKGLHIFQATLEEKPIWGSQIVVHQKGDRIWAENHLAMPRFKKSGVWITSHEQLKRQAIEVAKVKRLRTFEKEPVRISEIWFDQKGTLLPVYRVVLLAADPPGDFEVLVTPSQKFSRKISHEIMGTTFSLGSRKVISESLDGNPSKGRLNKKSKLSDFTGEMIMIGIDQFLNMFTLGEDYLLASQNDLIHGTCACQKNNYCSDPYSTLYSQCTADCTLASNTDYPRYARLNHLITLTHGYQAYCAPLDSLKNSNYHSCASIQSYYRSGAIHFISPFLVYP